MAPPPPPPPSLCTPRLSLQRSPLQASDLWNLELPEGQSVLSVPYGVLFLAGSALLFLVYLEWLLEVGGGWSRGRAVGPVAVRCTGCWRGSLRPSPLLLLCRCMRWRPAGARR